MKVFLIHHVHSLSLFQNGANVYLSKMVLKLFFLSKSSKFNVVQTIHFFFQSSPACGTNTY